MSLRYLSAAAAVLLLSVSGARAGTSGVALVQQGFSLNGTVEGNVQQMDGQNTNLNSGSSITGDFFVPGTPTLKINGSPVTFGGTIAGSGSTTPTGYTVTLNSNTQLGSLRTKTNPVTIPSVAAPPTPTGTRNVSIGSAGQSVGDFSTLCNLNLNANVGQYSIPPGTYGSFTCGSGSGFTLGVAGSSTPAVYNFQSLTINSGGNLAVVGPVIVTVASNSSMNGPMGRSDHLGWLTMQYSSGSFTLNQPATFYGSVIAPAGTVTINNQCVLTGLVSCAKLAVQSGGILRVQSPNLPPSVSIAAPAAGQVFPSGGTVTVRVTASDSDGTVAKVDYYDGTTLLGEVTSPDSAGGTTYSKAFSLGNGTHPLTAMATDDAGAITTSAAVAVIVENPPTVHLTSPVNQSIIVGPSNVTVTADASDSDGSVTKVEFFNGTTKIGESDAAPYSVVWSNVGSGTYTLTAVATDNQGLATTSTPVSVVLNQPPTVVITAPAVNALFAGPTNVTLSATASDADGSIAKVQFFNGPNLLGEATAAGNNASSFSLPVNFTPGSYSIIAVATDNLGTPTTSGSITFTVDAPPTIALTAPSNGIVVVSPNPTVLVANPADSDGTIARVDFFQNGNSTPIGTVTTAPYQLSVTGLASGTYTFTARATDNVGFTGDSAPITVTVDAAPTVAITSPHGGAVLPASTDVTISATGNDADGSVISVEFFNGQTSLGVSTVAPFQVTWPNVPAGNHTLTAVATDNLNVKATSAPVAVVVDVAPVVTLTAPANNAVLQIGTPVTLTATATDADGTITAVDFFNGTTLIGEATAAPYEVSWTPTQSGATVLTAVATDNAGLKTTSAPIQVTLDQAPVVAITDPTAGAFLPPGTPIVLSATATDADGAVAKVEFFDGTNSLGVVTTASDNASTYSLPVTLAVGSYSVTAVATDNLGIATTSSAIAFTVDAPPTIALTAPINGSVVVLPNPLVLVANPTDTDGKIAQVDFFQSGNSTPIGTVTAAPYQLSVTGLASGTYTFTARATDNVGLTGDAAPINVTVDAAPTVAITSPNTGAVLSASSNVTLSATANDVDGSVVGVEFFNGQTSLGVSTAAPFQVTWPSIPAGNYTLTAVATDNLGVKTTSAPVAVVVDVAPVVSVTAPTNNAVLPTGTAATLTATATDADGTIATVDFFNGKDLIGEVTNAPYQVSWTPTQAGTAVLTAVATDNVGLKTTSTPIQVTLDQAPTVAITAPIAGAFLQPGTPVTLSADASDADGTIAKVEFFNGPTKLGEVDALTTPPSSYALSFPSGLPSGHYSLTARATDNAGFATVSAPVAFAINTPPVATPANATTPSGTPVALTLSGTDVDGTALTYALATQPQHGTLSGTVPNLTYTAPASFGGVDSFTFTASDGQLTSPPATVTITSGLAPRSHTYTTSADFAAGQLIGVSTTVPDQISNQTVLASYDVIWVANSSKGTVVKLDPETGRALAEYQTAPSTTSSPYPSRIAIDSKGNAWVANYAADSIIKIGLPQYGGWVDRNANSQPDTSTGLGDIRSWTSDSLSSATDEAILLYIHTGFSGVRQISIDAKDNVWVGAPNAGWKYYDGRTGQLLRTETSIPQGGMGGFVTNDGTMYSAGTQFLIWNTANAASNSVAAAGIRSNTWESARDSQGNLWCTRDGTSTVAKYSPTGALIGEYYHGEPWGMGIAIDANDNVWIAHSHCGHSVGHLLPEGTFLGNVPVANHGPTEVSIDRHGRIWVTSSTGVVERINPLGGPLGTDAQTPVGEVDLHSGNLGGALWTYGRFTGSTTGLASPDGYWTAVFDGQLSSSTWGPVAWHGLIPNDAQIVVEAATSEDAVNYTPFETLTPSHPTPGASGRYLKTRVQLVSATTGETPILYDLTVGTIGYNAPAASPYWDVSAGTAIAGNWPDIVQLNGAFRRSVDYPVTEPSYAWSMVSGPGVVTFSNPANKRSTVQFSAQGNYVLRLTGTLNGVVSTSDVTVSLTPYNRAPYANAGYTTFISSFPPQLWLWGEVRDDGLPVGATVTSQWSTLFGPGGAQATFTNPSAASTQASFPTPGVYTLQLSATDTQYTTTNTTDVWIGVPPPPSPPSGLVSWWEASGNGDDHISGNQAFLESGAGYASGKLGGAFTFNGVNNRVRVFAAPNLDVGTQGGITIEFWYNPTNWRNATVLEYGSSSARGVNIRQAGYPLQVDFRDVNGGDHYVTTSNLSLNAWTHVAATYNQATGEARVFVNGLFNASANFGSIVLATNYDLFMGERGNTSEPYQGLLDEVSVYNRALYADEIYTIATSGKRPPVSNLPPVVSAGQAIFGQHVNTPIPLVGTVSDDGQPTNGQLTSKWSLVTGPGTATFGDATQVHTTVSFSAPGRYVLMLTADDGAFQSSATTTMLVDGLYTAPTDSSVSAWWNGAATDIDAVHSTKLERINGATYAAGKVGQAFSFDGVDDQSRVLPTSAIDVGSSAQGFTIEFWMYHTRGSGDVLFEWNDGSTSQLRIAFGGNGTTLDIAARDTNGTVHNNGSLSFALNQWNHFAFTYDPTTGEAASYLNGVRVYDVNWGQVTIRTTGALWAGCGVNGGSPFQGQLDEITLYKRPLSAAAINAIYQEGSIGKAPLDDTNWPTTSVGLSTIILPNTTGAATLSGTIADTGALSSSLLANWTWAGPGTVTFGNQNSAATTATFSAPGTYTLQLTANDTLNQAQPSTVEVRVGTVTAPVSNGLVAWWPMNGSPGDVINHNDIVLANNTSFTTGEVGLGLNFDGVSNLAWVPGSSTTAIGTAPNGFTVEFWLKLPATGGRNVLEWLDKSGTVRLQVGTANVNAAWFYISARDSLNNTYNSGNLAYSANQWNHFAFTYNRATGHLWAYVNGIRVADAAWGNINVPSDGTLWIGSGVNGDSRFTGTLDELALYNRPLTFDEVNAIYQAGQGGKTPPNIDLPPTVSAGPDVAIPSVGVAASLNGTVVDDNKPFKTLTCLWTTDSGPAQAVFGDNTQPTTTATFTVPGTYVLRLTASDGFTLPVSDVTTVRVGVATAQMPSGIAAWWPGNGDPHEVIHGGHDVTLLNGAGYVAGEVGEAFNFDGKDDFAWVSGSSDLDIGRSSQGFTIEFWMNDTVGNGAGITLLQWRGSDGNTQLQLSTGTYFGLYLNILARDTTGATHGFDSSGLYYGTNHWNHVAITYDPSTGMMYAYLNGVRQSAGTWGNITIPTDGTIWFGSGADGSSRFTGQLDEVTLYKRALSDAEINAIYQAGIAGKAPPGDNLPPTVSAGPSVVLPSIAVAATLSGTVTDDNKPFGPPLAHWSSVTGPGTVKFADQNAAATTATFTAPGVYELKLTGSDQFAAPVSDIMEVRVGVAAVEPAPAIAAWWPGNGTPHEVVNGNHDLQIINGVGYDVGQVGQGFTFDGTDQLAWVPGSSDLDIGRSSQGFTIEFWMKTSNTGSGPVLLHWGNPGSSSQLEISSGYYFGAFLSLTGRDTAGNTHTFDGTGGLYYSANQWSHFAFTYDPVSGQLVGYVNGVRQHIGTWGNVSIPTDGMLWFASGAGGVSRFGGMLDEVTLYKRALSYNEIYAAYQAGSAGKAPMDDDQPPSVSAGPDVVLANTAATATLAGVVTDDNRPFGAPLAHWSWVITPPGGGVSFGNQNAASTTATFTAPGTYLLQLTGTDQLNAPVSDFMEVRVGGVGASLPANVAAWWPFNTDARDIVHGHDATIRPGMGISPGKVLNALNFTSTNDYASVPANNDINVGTSTAGFSVEFWTRIDVMNGSTPLIAWTNGSQTGVQIQVASGFGTYYASIDITDTTGGGHHIIGPSIADQAGLWAHYVLTFDATTGTTKFYKNGGNTLTQNLGTGWTPQTSYPLWLGSLPSNNTFRGALDEVTLYTRPLTATEVGSIYAAGADGKLPPTQNLPPTIVFANPPSGISALLNQAIALNATAVDPDGTVAKVEFFDGSTKLGQVNASDAGQPSSFTFNVSSGFATLGRHSLTAVATDNSGAASTSSVVYVNVVPVLPVVAIANPATNVSVPANTAMTLAATASYSAGSVTKVEFFDGTTKLGESSAVVNGQYTLTLPSGFIAGGHTLTAKVTASDASTALSSAVTVLATSVPPNVTLTVPANKATLATNAPFTLTAMASDADGVVTKVEFFNGATSLGLASPTGTAGTYSFTAAALPAGNYTLTAVATDNSGLSTTSAAATVSVVTYAGAPKVEIVAPTDTGRISSPTTVTGVVATNGLVSWSLQYRLKAAEGATPDAWINLATGTSFVGTPGTNGAADAPGTLGTFDPTSLINGIYELRLTMTDASGTTSTAGPISVIVDGNMKLGVFSLAFEDMKVPVAGIPITLTRTYDSRDVRVGDFGPGWRLALANVRVQKNRNLGQGWYQTLQSGAGIQFYNVDPIGDRIVTITMPDGETHRFKIGAYVKNRLGDPDDASYAAVVTQGTLKFYPIGDTTSTLEPLDANNQLNDHFYIDGTGDQDLMTAAFGDVSATVYNTTRFRLTTKDGTVYILDEVLGLLQMTDLNGNTLVVNRDAQNRVTSVVSTLAPSSQSQVPTVTSVTVHRDATGRVDYIQDPAGKSLDYIYDAQGRLSSFTNRDSNVTQFFYENTGFPYYLTRIVDPRGVNAIRSEYNANGKMIKQIDANGKETDFNQGVDTTGNFEKVKDRLGNTTTFYYDDRGNVTLKIDPLGAQTSYAYYPDSDRVKLETDNYGNVKSTAYDDRGNVLVETIGASAADDPSNPTTGHITRTAYNANSAPTQIVDPDGRTQTFSYDAKTNNLLTQTVGAGGIAPATSTFTYNSDGTPSTMTDALGNVTSYTYTYGFSDPNYPGATKQVTVTVSQPSTSGAVVLRATRTLYDSQENQLAQIVTRHLPDGTAEDVITKYAYDAENRLVATIMPDGRVTETRYNAIGKDDKTVLWQSVADYTAHDDTKARVTSYGYDSNGNQTSVTYADGTTELTHFDAENRKDWSQDRAGYRTFFVYDADGRLTSTIYPDANDYTSGSTPPSSATDSRLADNPRTKTVYDLAGRVTDTYDEVGAHTQTVYYADGTADASRRKQTVQVRAAGNLVTTYQYDGAGNVRYVTDPRGNTVETQYDDQGRPTKVIYPATDENPSTSTVTQYDLLGRRIAVTDQEGKVTRYRYDGLGRLIEVRQYLDQSLAASDLDLHLTPSSSNVVSTTYTYDELGNQQTQTDALGRVTTFWTDSLGRRTKRTLPSDANTTAVSETLQYDGWGNLSQRTDFAGKTTTFNYDALNRLTSKVADPTHPSLTFTNAAARIEYDYDANGARKAARTYNAAGTLLYTETTPRDERGRVEYKDTPGGQLNYTYYANNLLKDVVSSNNAGANTDYRYDEANRLESVDDLSGVPDNVASPTVQTTSFTYNANGSLETMTQPNTVVHTYKYDTLNRLRTLVVSTLPGSTGTASVLHAYEYKLNPSGHRHEVIEGTKTTTYSYDALYRLTDEIIASDPNGNNGTVHYDLDKVGNRLSRAATDLLATRYSLPTTSYTYNSRDWLNSDTYDANGNTVKGLLAPSILTPGSFSDSYDFENRLIVRTRTDGSTVNITYDADGNRIAKNILDASGATVSSTTWLVDTNNLTGYAQVLEERISTGGPTPSSTLNVYTYGNQLISQSLVSGPSSLVTRYYAFDGHGNVRELTDSTGAITDRYDYDAFGNLIYVATLNASTGTLTSQSPGSWLQNPDSSQNHYLYCGEQYDGDLGLYYNRARYLNTDSARFWSMDSYEGKAADPLSLNKYVYSAGDPVHYHDPSGHLGLLDFAFIGMWVHIWIGEDFESEDRTHRFSNSVSIGELATEALGEAYDEPLRPDLVDTLPVPWDLYEIKPARSVKMGYRQLGRYIDTLNIYGIPGLPGITYTPPPVIPPPPMYWNIKINSWLEGPGLILYKITGSQQGADIMHVEADLLIIRTLNQLSSKAEQAGEADVEATVSTGASEELALAA